MCCKTIAKVQCNRLMCHYHWATTFSCRCKAIANLQWSMISIAILQHCFHAFQQVLLICNRIAMEHNEYYNFATMFACLAKMLLICNRFLFYCKFISNQQRICVHYFHSKQYFFLKRPDLTKEVKQTFNLVKHGQIDKIFIF